MDDLTTLDQYFFEKLLSEDQNNNCNVQTHMQAQQSYDTNNTMEPNINIISLNEKMVSKKH